LILATSPLEHPCQISARAGKKKDILKS
jgi:hypothetical protein